MASSIRHITLDCTDAYALATFWAAVLDAPISEEDAPGDDEVLVETPGIALLLIQVPEGKTVKNRMHLDLEPRDRTRDAEVRRLLDLGATLHADHRDLDGGGWVTLADPEGNEFCVERGPADRA